MTDTENEKPMTTREVLDYLEIGRTKLYEIIKEGRLAPLPKNPLKQIERLRFRRADVEALRPPPSG
jgi:predicted DNA-binding transcriptional regulator AlpA